MASVPSIVLTAELETVTILTAQAKPNRAIQPQRVPPSPATGQSAESGPLTATSSAQLPAIVADCVVQEKHEDDMVITEHPVEQGATITDHAYKIPARLELTYAWSPASKQNAGQTPAAFLSGIYQNLVGLQAGRALLTVLTGKRSYKNMLIEGLSVTTDKETENVLVIVVSLREIFLATTQVTLAANVPSDPSAHQFPQQTLPSVNNGSVSLQPATNFNGSLYPGGGTNIP